MLSLVTLPLLIALPAFAAKPNAAKADEGPPKESKTDISVQGTYAIWGLTQRNFMLGADHPLNNADYVVQMLRLQPAFQKEHYGVVARLDAAQGWWGVDNNPDVEAVESVNPTDGTVTSTQTYNPYAMFRNKDTNYDVHFDHAYVWFMIPGLPVDIKVQAGRQYMAVGQKLVLDQDLDGIVVSIAAGKTVSAELLGAKISEGTGSVKAPAGTLMNDDELNADANLGGGRLLVNTKTTKAELFGLAYKDNSGDGLSTYLPQGYGYFNSRFRPNVSQAAAFGVSASGQLDVAEGLLWVVEADYLMGKDDVKNEDFAAGVLDKNDGTLRGWNIYAKLDQGLDIGIPLGLGAIFGMGSGDDDVSGGAGNLNKIQTMGSFPLTNVWEDSIMPDVGGISPQGLGSPVSRGYRELENTTAVQGRVRIQPAKPLELVATYTWLHATQAISGFDEAGNPGAGAAQDIGSEVDVNATVTLVKGLTYGVESGIFMPGEAASLLLVGTANQLDRAWEVKQVLTAKF